MSGLVTQAIEFSNGRWVSVSAMMAALNVTDSRKNPLFRMTMLGSKVALQTQSNSAGIVVRYKAYEVRGKTPIELAKHRKSHGIMGSIESVRFGG